MIRPRNGEPPSGGTITGPDLGERHRCREAGSTPAAGTNTEVAHGVVEPVHRPSGALAEHRLCKPADAGSTPALGSMPWEGARRGAVISACGRFRYVLWERLATTKPLGNLFEEINVEEERARRGWTRWICWVMLNPSTADALQDDPTIRKVRGFTERLGYDGFLVVNRFAWRATDPRELYRVRPGPSGADLGDARCAGSTCGGRCIHAAAAGPENDAWVARAADASRRIICAWGVHGGEYPLDFLRVLRGPPEDGRRSLYALKVSSASRTPAHPLYLSYDLKPIEWNP
jgi:hypothetical protein